MNESFKPRSEQQQTEQQPNKPDTEAVKEMSPEERGQLLEAVQGMPHRERVRFLQEAEDDSLPKEVAFCLVWHQNMEFPELSYEVASHIQKFITSERVEIFRRLMQSYEGRIGIHYNIDKFQFLTSDRDLTMEYARAVSASWIIEKIDAFPCITADDLLPMLMEKEMVKK